MNNEQITTILKDLNKISGFRVSLHSTSFEEVAAYPEKKNGFCDYIQGSSESECELCRGCDKEACQSVQSSGEPMIYKCRHNLVEAISPLYNFGILTGYLMLGQVRVLGEDNIQMICTLKKNGLSDAEAKTIAESIPEIEENKIKSFVNIMTVCASYLTLSNAVSSTKASVGQLTKKFISERFTDKISVKDICEAVGYSKSTVLAAFKKEFSTTVNSYLTTLRLERSKKMLENDNAPINEVALSCGFSDQSYFSKVFSAAYGITPTEYRRER